MSINEFVKQFGIKQEKWCLGELITSVTSEPIGVKFKIFQSGEKGIFTLEENPDIEFPGEQFQLPGEQVTGKQRKELFLKSKNGNTLQILNIERNGKFTISSKDLALDFIANES